MIRIGLAASLAVGTVLAVTPSVAQQVDSEAHEEALPDWMVGYFQGYNKMVVALKIREDGRVTAIAGGKPLPASVRHQILYVGQAAFELLRTKKGIATVQIGNPSNRVDYERIE